jgi:subtilisin-like proprotein convertase family protein
VLAVALLLRTGTAPAPPAAAVVRGSSTPGTAIPDGSPIGLTDTIMLDGGDARVVRLDVAVRFEHRFPGEVSGVLTAPDGRLATLVTAGAADAGTDLRLSSTQPASALQNLLGAPISGPWRLTLTDGIPADAGQLVSWTITARSGSDDAPPPVAAPGTGSGSSAPGRPVPDDTGEAASDTIELTGAGAVERVRVSVEVQHPVPADLLLQLRAPDGQLVTLADHVDAAPSTYASSEPGSPLAALAGGPLAGAWELVVLDDVAADEGTLVAWELSVNG